VIAEGQVREWLAWLQAAADDYCETRRIAYEIQRRSKPGPLHSAATECRIASFRATTCLATQRHIEPAKSAVAALQRTLLTLIGEAAAQG
jgi:hypothetical protein